VRFLPGDESYFMTGSNPDIDGGLPGPDQCGLLARDDLQLRTSHISDPTATDAATTRPVELPISEAIVAIRSANT